MQQNPRIVDLFTTKTSLKENALHPSWSKSSGHVLTVAHESHRETSSESVPISTLVVSTARILCKMPQEQFERINVVDSCTAPFDDAPGCIPWSEPLFQNQVILTCAISALDDPEDCIGATRDDTEATELIEADRVLLSRRVSCDVGITGLDTSEFSLKDSGLVAMTIIDTVTSASTEITSHDEDDSEDPSSVYEFFDDVSVLTVDSSMEGADDDDYQEEMSSCSECPGFQHRPVPYDSAEDLSSDGGSIPVTGTVISSPSPIDTPIDAFQGHLDFVNEESPSLEITHATEDFRLMSFLMDFCIEGKT
jgi:hypothetical protein